MKLGLIGIPGAGKTFLLGTLLKGGWKLHIHDFDGNLQILRPHATEENCVVKSYNSRDAKIWDLVKREADKICQLPANEVVVFDSLSHLSEAMLKAGNVKFPENSYDAYEFVIEELKDFLARLSSQAACHLIFNCHARYLENDRKLLRLVPSIVGQGMPFALSKYLNNLWLIETTTKERFVTTTSTSMADLKKSDLSLATTEPFDLALIFKKMGITP